MTSKTCSESTADDGRETALAVPPRYVAEVLCPHLRPAVRRRLGQVRGRYVSLDDLDALGLLPGPRPTLDEVDTWCQRVLHQGLQFYTEDLPAEDLRAIVTGLDRRREVALSTLQGVAASTGIEYAVLAVKRLRDRNTVARAESRRGAPALTLTVGDLLGLGATEADLDGLATADESTRAASVMIAERWTEEDRTTTRRPVQPAGQITLTRSSEVTREHIDWLWTTERLDPNTCVAAALIPLRGLTLVAGREGAAKSLFTLWLAA